MYMCQCTTYMYVHAQMDTCKICTHAYVSIIFHILPTTTAFVHINFHIHTHPRENRSPVYILAWGTCLANSILAGGGTCTFPQALEL